MSKQMSLAVELAELLAPRESHPAIRQAAIQYTSHYSTSERALCRFLRLIQDGLDFGKWPR